MDEPVHSSAQSTPPPLQPTSASSPITPTTTPMLLGVLGGSALAVGAFLPWITLTAPFVGRLTVSGIEGGDGWFAVALGGVAAVNALRQWGNSTVLLRNILLICGLAGGLLTIYELGDISSGFAEARAEMDAEGDFFGTRPSDLVSTEMGVGIYLMGLGSAAVLAGSFGVFKQLATSQTPSHRRAS